MDCRRTLGLGVCLLIGAVGCAGQKPMVPVVPPAQASKAPPAVEHVSLNALPPGAVVKPLELPKKTPQPATCVAAGDFNAKEAAAETSATARREKQETARKAYEQAISLDPHYLPAYLSLARFEVALKDHTDAEATYSKAARLSPKEPRVFFEMGKCYVGEAKWDAAIQAFSHAAELDPKNRPYVDTLAWVQARAGHYDDSLATFRRQYDEVEAHYKLAQMLDYMGQKELCRQHLQLALAGDAKMEKAKVLLARLDAPPPPPDGGVKPASFVTAAKPAAPAATPATATSPTATGVILPPTPYIPIRYAAAAATSSPPPPPPPPALPGPDRNELTYGNRE